MRNSIYIILFSIMSLSCEKDKNHSGLPVDGDGNEYDTIVIGTQTWFKENLKSTSYRNGDPVRLVTDNSQWTTWQQGAYCWYDNNPAYKDTYGALYNWFAAHTQALCPVGWHVPITEEWTTLIDYLGGEYFAGRKLKEAGIQHWEISNQGTNESGFIGLPGGHRYFLDGSFRMIRQVGEFWAADVEKKVSIFYSADQANVLNWYKTAGLSVRCIKNKK